VEIVDTVETAMTVVTVVNGFTDKAAYKENILFVVTVVK
jgi:hypothetical protein